MAALAALCALVTLAARGADEAEPPAGAKAELAKLKGTWVVTRRVLGGREAKAPAGLVYTFDGGGKVTRRFAAPAGKAGGRQVLTVTLDTRGKPHRMTLSSGGARKDTVYIYKVEKGELHLATGRGKGAKAPADFKGDDVLLMVLKKEEKGKK